MRIVVGLISSPLPLQNHNATVFFLSPAHTAHSFVFYSLFFANSERALVSRVLSFVEQRSESPVSLSTCLLPHRRRAGINNPTAVRFVLILVSRMVGMFCSLRECVGCVANSQGPKLRLCVPVYWKRYLFDMTARKLERQIYPRSQPDVHVSYITTRRRRGCYLVVWPLSILRYASPGGGGNSAPLSESRPRGDPTVRLRRARPTRSNTYL